jgi:hypothetical protein
VILIKEETRDGMRTNAFEDDDTLLKEGNMSKADRIYSQKMRAENQG